LVLLPQIWAKYLQHFKHIQHRVVALKRRFLGEPLDLRQQRLFVKIVTNCKHFLIHLPNEGGHLRRIAYGPRNREIQVVRGGRCTLQTA